MARTYLAGRIEASRTVALLALGDLVALVVFAALGEYRHAGTVLATVETALQFGVGWLVVAVLAGAYGPRALDGWPRAAALGVGAWALGAVLGAVVRFVTEPGASLDPVFVLVTVGVGAVLFGVWRAVAARIL